MSTKKIEAVTEKGSKYHISVSMEYIEKVHKGWYQLSGIEQRETMAIFMDKIEKFITGSDAKLISSMSFIDENLELKQAISIHPISEVQNLCNNQIGILLKASKEIINSTPLKKLVGYAAYDGNGYSKDFEEINKKKK
jgi:hypothetical protein